MCSDGCVEVCTGDVGQVLEPRSEGGAGSVSAVTDIGEPGVIKVGAVRNGEDVGKEGRKVVSFTGIIWEGAIVEKERVWSSGLGAGEAMESVPVLGGVDRKVGIESSTCLSPVPAFLGSCVAACVSL